MAAGSTTLVAGQTLAQYRALNANLIGAAFDAILDITKSSSNILAQLQGSMGSNKPFVIKDDLTKGAKDTIHFNVGTSLGQAGRRGTDVAVNFEEPLYHNSWQVQIDTLRVVVGWNEITAVVATTGQSWEEVYAQLVGERAGQIEQEDMLIRMRTRATGFNTIRPGNKTTLDSLKYDDTFDTQTLNRTISALASLGSKPAMIGKAGGGMPLVKYIALGGNLLVESLWNDPTFTQSLQKADVRGDGNPLWTGELPEWRGTVIKRWDIVNHDNPGAIGSTLMPQGILGDCYTNTGTNTSGGTTTLISGSLVIPGQQTVPITIFGGGRSQATLGNANVLYCPFEYFLGCNKNVGQSIQVLSAADTNVYYFIIVDPVDGKWNLYSYYGSAAFVTPTNGYPGNNITVLNALSASNAGTAPANSLLANYSVTQLGGMTWDSTQNKEAFPSGALIVQVNVNVVPIGDVMVFGANAGAKAYGNVKNKRITQKTDYDALVGYGIHSIFGADMRTDTQGNYRGWVRVQCAYELPGVSLPQF